MPSILNNYRFISFKNDSTPYTWYQYTWCSGCIMDQFLKTQVSDGLRKQWIEIIFCWNKWKTFLDEIDWFSTKWLNGLHLLVHITIGSLHIWYIWINYWIYLPKFIYYFNYSHRSPNAHCAFAQYIIHFIKIIISFSAKKKPKRQRNIIYWRAI